VSSEEYIIVGKLGRPRGLSGDIYVIPDTDFPQRFVGLKKIYVKNRDRWEKRSLVSSRMVSGRPVLHFENVTTPEEAARLTNRDLAVLKGHTVTLPQDTYYIFDLVDCEVWEEKTNHYIGQLIDVERYPANDVYVIESASGKVLRCPVVKQYVKKIDIKGQKITIDTTGLLEEEKT